MSTNNVEKQSVIEQLKNQVKKASANIKAKIVVENGLHKVAISSTEIENFYDNQLVSAIKVADLDSTLVDFINENTEEAAKEMLSTFASEYKPAKVAANSTLNNDTAYKTTEKQLADQKTKLHPRTDDAPMNITEKQLPENNQRPGTYLSTTEAQLRDEKNTFYGKERISGNRKDEDRNMVTESQLSDMDKFNTLPKREEMSIKYEGGMDKQHHQVAEKQLSELLSHHTWTQPNTITESQLAAQEGELSRLASDQLNQFIKEATNCFAKTVIAAGVTPSHVIDIASRLVSHESKIPAFIDTLNKYSSFDVSQIDKKIARASHFGKTANTNQDWSDALVADVLVNLLSKTANTYATAQAVSALVEDASFVENINKSTDELLTQKTSNKNKFKEVLSQAKKTTPAKENADEQNSKTNESKECIVTVGTNEDGIYVYAGDISDVDEDPENQEAFSKAASTLALTKIKTKFSIAKLEPQEVKVDTANGTFEATFVDKQQAHEYKLAQRAKARKELAKQAQLGGGAPPVPAGTPELGNPNTPPTGGDMGMPPAESLTQNPEPEMPAEPETSNEPMPPGSFCPVCKSEDVDVEGGEFKCNSCGSDGEIEVAFKIKNAPGIIKEKEKEKEGFGLNDEEMAPEGATPPNVPVSASVRLTYKTLEKLAQLNSTFGKVCPNCSSDDTDLTKSASNKRLNGFCWNCHQNYAVLAKKQNNSVIGQYVWVPNKTADCNSCNRLKTSFVNSLKQYGISYEDFMNKHTPYEQADLILKVSKAGLLNINKEIKSPLPLNKIAASARWKEYEKFDNFPMASCIERIARKHGENATSMSGPCEGKNLAKCVCSQLAGLGIYTDGLAAKVASVHVSKDPMINNPMKTCIAMFVRERNMDVDDACTVCDTLRAAYASSADLAIEAIAQSMPMSKPLAKPMDEVIDQEPEMNDHDSEDAMDLPSDTVMEETVDLPCDDCKLEEKVELNDNKSPDMSVELEGDIDSLLDNDMVEFGDKSVTITLPENVVESLKTLFDTLKEQVSGLDSMDDSMDNSMDDIDSDLDSDSVMNTDNDSEMKFESNPDSDMKDDSTLDVGDVNSDVEEDLELDSDSTSDSTDDSGIPGLDEAKQESEDSMMESKDMPKPAIMKHTENQPKENKCDCSCECDKPKSKKSEDESENKDNSDKKEETKEKTEKSESKEDSSESEDSHSDNKPDKEAELVSLLSSMKKGANKTVKASTDSMYDRLIGQLHKIKTAKNANDEVQKVEYKTMSEKKLTKNPAQDTKEIGKYSDGKTMGHEEKFDVKGPDVPRKDQLLGDEDKSLVVKDSDMPSIPTAGKNMEGEENYKPEKGNVVDGNQGKKS